MIKFKHSSVTKKIKIKIKKKSLKKAKSKLIKKVDIETDKLNQF